MIARLCKWMAVAALAAAMTGCAVHQAKPYDYTAFKESKPKSILVLPPLNESPDIDATYSVLSQVTVPLGEAGYYVMPVALVDESFRQNGLTVAGDIHQVSPAKLREIFGADAALYIKIKQYGTKYMVLDSATVVTVSADLIDLRNGAKLWSGAASASNNEGGNNSGGGLIGMLITAAVKQIVNSVSNAGYTVAGTANARLLSAGHPNGLLYGPRSPKYGTD
ncbi:hypothetical protein LV28_06470 [Pandoraea pnomenusa]|uniref:Lipoprotein n=1 Tax=Pandoraea pnomenusa TaxID=93220 RepID=A0A378YH98_9BURK|nr:DUF799 domain-containing protein [Pandoraea pnomenusa]AHB05201.1 lipoprotein [Pandoraea pnomenusa 3kgm]AIU26235.1 hypothetical protein LV28_06470 [Pandoraea pnomenusa]ANC43487.1 hypothetical protein A6P55_03675 [Pandoraea pnomenusa]MBN9092844.1 DUF799 domain-containing protein [Pandoraea pnomenusa]SUA76218.1 Putative lipoprotein NMB1124/NMB1162 precursor [Pandoraea pnomenusa]